MAHYGLESRQKLGHAHADLVRVAEAIIEHRDAIIIETSRADERQKLLFAQGRSKLDGITRRSLHQTDAEHPKSRAIDLAPYFADEWPRIPWATSPLTDPQMLENLKRWHTFCGEVMGLAWGLGVELRGGFDWDGDQKHNDQSFHDLPHFELL